MHQLPVPGNGPISTGCKGKGSVQSLSVRIIRSSVLPRTFTCVYHYDDFISSAAAGKSFLLTAAIIFSNFAKRFA
jgi:hypothetical protein